MSRDYVWPISPDGRQVRLNAGTGAVEVFASDLTTLLHSTGSSGGGITLWATGTAYTVGQHVNATDRVYRCITAHTASALFSTDTANWVEVSDGANGASGELQFASATGKLASSAQLNWNAAGSVLTAANVQVTGTWRWFDPVDVPTITADQNDFNPFGGNLVTSCWAIAGDAANRALTGILAPANDGTVLNLVNKGTQPILLRGSNTGSAAANRFAWTGDWTLRPGEGAPLMYSADLVRWAAMVPVPQAASYTIEHSDSVVGAVAVNDATTPPWPVPITGTLTGVRVTAGVALTGGDITVTITRISPGAFTTNPVIMVASGAISTLFTPGTAITVAPGDLLVATVTALTATNVTALSVQYLVST